MEVVLEWWRGTVAAVESENDGDEGAVETIATHRCIGVEALVRASGEDQGRRAVVYYWGC